MNTRRDFLRASSLVSLTPILPGIVGDTATATEARSDDKVLIVVQLQGGNDGINTVVPFGDDGYGRARRKLRIKTSELHRLNNHVGLHPNMRPAFELFNEGRLSIIQGVGYPNPNRSHFRSMRIWHTASEDESDHIGNGWLGSALDQQMLAGLSAHASTEADAVFVGTEQLPPALWGRRSSAISLSKAEDLQLSLRSPARVTPAGDDGSNAVEDFVRKQFVAATNAAESFAAMEKDVSSETNYPSGPLASQLKFVSKLIRSGNKARIYYTIHSGFDTHAEQRFTHSRLLGQFSAALKAFLDEMKTVALEDRVVVLAFSEFGRRVSENDSGGTDHGSSGPVFLAGQPVSGGLVGDTPDMSELVEGDLKTLIDFRRIYASILQDWLNVDPARVLPGNYQGLSLFG